MTRSAVAAIACVLTGCGGAATAATTPATVPPDAGESPDVVQVRAGLAETGWTRREADETVAFLVEGRSETRRVRVPAGRCLTLAARSAAGIRDLDATVFTPEGEQLAEDIEPDAHPTVQVCGTPGGATVYLVLTALTGQGSFSLLVYEGNREDLAAARGVVGGRPGVAMVAARSTMSPAGASILEALSSFSTAVEGHGFTALGEPVTLTGPRDAAPFERALHARAGRCYTVAGFLDPGTRPIALTLADAWGTPRARSDPGDDHAALQWCAEETGPFVIRVADLAPGATLRLAVWVAPASEVGGGRDLWLGRPPGPEARRRGEARTVAAAALDGAGFGPVRPMVETRLVAGGATEVSLRRGRPGRCRMVLAVPAGALASVSLELRSPPRAPSPGLPVVDGSGAAAVADCTGRAARVRVVASAGGGPVTVLLAERPLSDSVVAELPLDHAGPGLTAHLAATTSQPAPTWVGQPVAVAPGSDGPSSSPDAGGRCHRLFFVGAPGARVTMGRTPPSQAEGEGPVTRLAACGADAVHQRFEVGDAAVGGDAVLGVAVRATRPSS